MNLKGDAALKWSTSDRVSKWGKIVVENISLWKIAIASIISGPQGTYFKKSM